MKKLVHINEIPLLCQPNCKIKDVRKLETKINDFICAGLDRLQVVSDFDYTITKQRTEDGTPVLTSFNIFEACESLPPEVLKESRRQEEKYHPLEIDPKIPKEEKVKYMLEWWSEADKLLRYVKLLYLQ